MRKTDTLLAFAALLLLVLPPAHAGELYAQAIGAPPERPAVPAKPAPEPEEADEQAAPPPAEQTTAAAEPARRDELRTRILIGAGLALALGALAGGGNGGDAPAGGETVPEHF